MTVVGGIVANVRTGLEIINDVVEGKAFAYFVEKSITKVFMNIVTGKVGKLSKNDSVRLVNESVISIFDKTIDDARINKKGSYKENKK